MQANLIALSISTHLEREREQLARIVVISGAVQETVDPAVPCEGERHRSLTDLSQFYKLDTVTVTLLSM